MCISQLQAKVSRLEQGLEGTRQQLVHGIDSPATFTAELAQSRAYAFAPKILSLEDVVEGCAGSLDNYGFCVIENVIPTEEVPAIHQEILETQTTVS